MRQAIAAQRLPLRVPVAVKSTMLPSASRANVTLR
jgi:hypothetical protein